jgi:hypothetical protein
LTNKPPPKGLPPKISNKTYQLKTIVSQKPPANVTKHAKIEHIIIHKKIYSQKYTAKNTTPSPKKNMENHRP